MCATKRVAKVLARMGVFKSEGVKCECDREFGIIVFWLMNLDNTIYIDGGFSFVLS